MSQFKLKHYTWISGKLNVADHSFESLHNAKVFCGTLSGGHAKVWNEHGELVHQHEVEEHHHHHHHHHHYA